jgi:hypothetical protein
MLVYNYNPITKEYIDYSNAELDPEETKIQGKDVYLIPANATLKEPPNVKKNQIQVFHNDWYIEPDFRGQYMVGEEMQPIEIKEIGDLPLGYALITEEQIELLTEKGTNYFIIQNGKLIVNPNYEEEQAEKERERILNLSMTRSDFFDGTIKAFGADSDDLLISIQMVLRALEIPEVDKKVAINNYKNALNFYRRHPLFTLLSNIPIPLSEERTITITTEQWDRFFDETDKKNPDAYKELLS